MATNVGASAMSQLAKNIYGIESEQQDGTQQTGSAAMLGDMFKEQLGKVNDLQKESDAMTLQMAAGKVDNVEEVLIKAEEARIALDLAVQITNKVTQAYQEIMRMQV